MRLLLVMLLNTSISRLESAKLVVRGDCRHSVADLMVRILRLPMMCIVDLLSLTLFRRQCVLRVQIVAAWGPMSTLRLLIDIFLR